MVHPVFQGPFRGLFKHLVDQLETIGIEVEPVAVDVPELSRLGRAGECDLVLSRWVAVYPDADGFFTGLFDSKDGMAAILVGSHAIDRLLDAGRREQDTALRRAIYRQLEDLLAEEDRVVPLFHGQTCRFARRDVRGLRLGITIPEVRFEDLEIVTGDRNTSC